MAREKNGLTVRGERMEAPYIMSNDDSSALAKKVLEVWKRSRLEATLRWPADGLMEPREKKDADAGRSCYDKTKRKPLGTSLEPQEIGD